MTHDTSKEAVERLAQDLVDNADLDAAEGGNMDVCNMEWKAASTLRAILAELETLKNAALAETQRAEQAERRERSLLDTTADLRALRMAHNAQGRSLKQAEARVAELDGE